MKSKLYIIEGLPCSGKSTTSAYVADILSAEKKVCFVDEGTGDHPADYEFHSFLNKDALENFSEEEQSRILSTSEKTVRGYIVPLSEFEGELFNKLLENKIYDFLTWDVEKPLMLDKWRDFVKNADNDTVYVFNCVLLQNPMCETMMRFGFDVGESFEHISEITRIIEPLKPAVIYLKNTQIEASVKKASKEREGWLDAVIDYHVNGEYGKSINASGFDGYIRCLEERQIRELEILEKLDVRKIVLNNPQNNWAKARKEIKEFIK